MKANLARFDFGVCMAGWDGDVIYVAPEYKRDVESKSFTLCRADNLAQFSYSHSACSRPSTRSVRTTTKTTRPTSGCRARSSGSSG